MAEAIDIIQQRCRCVITYEDPRWSVGDARQTADVTQKAKTSSRQATAVVMAPVLEKFDFEFNSPAVIHGPEDWAPAVNQMLTAFSRTTHTGVRFRVDQAVGALHVVPISATPSILSARVSLAEREAPAYDIVKELLEAISLSAGTQVSLGQYPSDHLFRSIITAGAKNELARDVLGRVLNATGRKLSWRLNYDPTFGRFFLFLRLADPETCTWLTPEQSEFKRSFPVCQMDPGDSNNAVFRRGQRQGSVGR